MKRINKQRILALTICGILLMNNTLPIAAGGNQGRSISLDEEVILEDKVLEGMDLEIDFEDEEISPNFSENEKGSDATELEEETTGFEEIQVNVSFNSVEEDTTEDTTEDYTGDSNVETGTTASTEFTFNPETNTIVSYSTHYDATKDIVIPVEINGVEVLHIGEYAFSARNLTSLSFEDGCKVETIGYRAFYNNTTLVGDVEIPNTVINIESDAFYLTSLSVMYFTVDRSEITFGINTDTTNSVTLSKYYNGGIIEDKNTYYKNTTYGILATGEATIFSTVGIETAMVFPGLSYDKDNALLIEDASSTVLQYYGSHIEGQSHVDIPNGIKHIADYAMYRDTELKTISFPSSLETVGTQAFQLSTVEELDFTNTKLSTIALYGSYDNTSLEILKFPTSLTYIGREAFRGCTALIDIIGFEDTPFTTTEVGIFRGCSSLETVTLPKNLISTGSYAFYETTSLVEIVFPETITTVGSYSFYGASSLPELNLPESVTYLEDYSFSRCTSLVDLNFSDNIYEIGTNAFSNCTSLVEVTLPKGLITLGASAFYYCSKITTVNFNDKLNEIGTSAFNYCSSLTQVYSDEYPIPESITTLGTSIFANTAKLTGTIEFTGVTTLGTSTYGSFYGSGFTEIILPNPGLIEIPQATFRGASKLESVTLTDYVTTINANVFYECSKLTTINIIKTDGTLESNANRMPISIIAIQSYTFYKCTSLAEFNLNEGTTEIGSNAFNQCSKIAELHIPSTIETIGSAAFSNTASNGRFYIDRPYASVDGESWSAEETTWIIWNDMEIGNVYGDDGELDHQFLLAFDEEGGAIITNSYLPNRALVIPAQVVDQDDDNTWYTITKIANSAFYESTITSLYIESGIQEIGTYAFSRSSSLKTVVIEDGLSILGGGAFSSCTGVTSIEIGEGLEVLQTGTLITCTNLSSLILPESLVLVESGMFTVSGSYATTKLYEITFPGKIEFEESYNTLPSCLKTLKLTGYSSTEHDADLSGLGFSVEDGFVYYSDTVEVTIDSGTYLYDTDSSQWNKYLGDGLESELYLPESVLIDDTTYYPVSMNNYFLMGSQTTVKVLHIPSGVETISDMTFYQKDGYNGLRLVYIDKLTDSIPDAPWGNDYPLFYVIWSDTPVYNDFISDVNEDGEATLVGYIGSKSSIELEDFPIWVEATQNISNIMPVYTYQPIEEVADQNITATTMGDYLFYLNDCIEEINISSTIVSMGDYSFSEMKSLERVTFDEGLLSIGNYTFSNTQVVAELILPESLDVIGDYAFYECNDIEVLQLPRIMNEDGIGAYSLSRMDKLKVIELPDNLTQIPSYFGNDLDALEYLSIPPSVTSIGYYFLRGTTYYGYTRIVEFLDRNEGDALSESWKSYSTTGTASNKSYKFQGVVLYADRIYEDMYLYSIPTSTILSYHGNHEYFEHIDVQEKFNGRGNGVYYDKIQTNDDTNVYYPETLGDDLFSLYDNSRLVGEVFLVYKTITIPDTIKHIGSSVFREALIEEIDLPDSVETIGDYAFYQCTNIETITMPYNLMTIGNYAFANCTLLTYATFYEGLESIGDYAFTKTNFYFLDLPDSVKTLGNGAFASCYELEKVTFGVMDSHLEYISGTATSTTGSFYDTPKLNNLNIAGTRGSFDNSVASEAPWGSSAADVTVYYLGEYVIFDYYVVRHEDYESEIKYYINIWAYCQSNLISEIHFPEQEWNISQIGTHNWQSFADPYIYEVYEYGMYRFEGFDNSGYDASNVQYIFIEEYEVPEVEAEDIYVKPSEVVNITEEEILDRANAIGYTTSGLSLDPFIYYPTGDVIENTNAEFRDDIVQSLEEIQGLADGNVGDRVTAYATVYYKQYGAYALQEFDIILISEGTPIVGGNDIILKELEVPDLTLKELERMIEAYAKSYDETRDLEPNIVDLESKLTEIKTASVGDSIVIKLWAYDEMMLRTGYGEVTVTIREQGYPIIDATDIYVLEIDLGDVNEEYILTHSQVRAFSYDRQREFHRDEIIIDDSETVIEEVQLLKVDDTYRISFRIYDQEEGEWGYKTITLHVLDTSAPYIYAQNFYVYEYQLSEYEVREPESDSELSDGEDDGEVDDDTASDELEVMNISENDAFTLEDLFELVKEKTEVYATNYDRTTDLEVIGNPDDYIDFTSRILENSTVSITYSAYDEVEEMAVAKTVEAIYVPDPIVPDTLDTPEEPVDPDAPPRPDTLEEAVDPDTQIEPMEPDNSDDSLDGEEGSADSDTNESFIEKIKTGDSTMIFIYFVSMLFSIMGALILLKTRNQDESRN